MGHQSNANKFLKNILNKTKQEFIPTGFYTFDERNMGLIPGSLVTVAATSGGGKSLMAVQLGINIARAGKRVRLVPLEMTKEECYARVVSNISGISMRKIMNGKLTDREKAKVKKKWKAFEKECKRLGGRFTIWDPEEDLSMEDVLNIAKPYNDDVIMIDYIGLLSGVDGDDAWQALGRVARYAKIWAKNNKKVVILAAQLSDDGQIRYSRAIKEHSNLMWTWTYGDENRESGVIDIVQQKARNQDPFDFQLGVDMAGMRMYDLDGDVETHRPKKGQLSTKSKKGEKAHAKLKDSSDDVGAYL